jgi:hypothetical protein
MKTIILFASISIASGLLLTNIYTSIVDAKSWGSNIPDSIAAARAYYTTVSPANFFRLFSPINQLLAILVFILFWKSVPSIRMYTGAALVMYLVAEAMTFGYFYPRNAILFNTASLTDIDLLKKTWSQWNSMNWVRSGILLTGIVFSFLALFRIFAKQ